MNYGKSFAFNMAATGFDFQKSIEGIDAANLAFGNIGKFLPPKTTEIAVDFTKNLANNFIDFNGKDGIKLKVNSGTEILNNIAKSLVHTGIDATTRGQQKILGDQIPKHTNDFIKRILGSDGG